MAELSLAIVPLCFEAFRLGKAVHSRFGSFKKYMDIVDEHRTNLDIQIIIFVSECQAILTKASKGCPGINAAMLVKQAIKLRGGTIDKQLEKDLSSTDMNNSLDAMFGSSTNTLKTLLNVIVRKIGAITEDLGRYGEVNEDGREIGVGSVLHRTQNRVALAMQEKRYAKAIGELRTLVSDLRDLRERATGDSAHSLVPHQNTIKLPAEDRIRGQDASLLLRGITAKWSCSQLAHTASPHEAKLLLSNTDASNFEDTTPTFFTLLIQTNQLPRKLVSSQFHIKPMPKPNSTWLPSPENSSLDEENEATEQKRQRLNMDQRRLGIKPADTVITQEKLSALAKMDQQNFYLNLGEATDVCSHLCVPDNQKRRRGKTAMQRPYLDFKNRRFEFSTSQNALDGICFGLDKLDEPIGLQNLFLQQDLDDNFSDAERFWLASVIVKSALRHFNTAWWAESWTLDELKFYDLNTDDLMDSLQTLHLSSTLPTNCQANNDGDDIVMLEDASKPPPRIQIKTKDDNAFGQEMMQVGIRNLTLWGVGVALLQIGLGRQVSWSDHVQVRQSVAKLKRFSMRYHDITDKLINCDFGQGARLQKIELQNEVYRTVVCELEGALNDFREAGLWHL